MRDVTDTHGFKIIVTDSNSRVRDLVKRELEQEGYSVSSLKNGQEILELIVHPESVDLIILDPELFCPYSQRVFQSLSCTSLKVPIIIHSFRDQLPNIEPLEPFCFINKDANSIRHLKEVVRSCYGAKRSGRPS